MILNKGRLLKIININSFLTNLLKNTRQNETYWIGLNLENTTTGIIFKNYKLYRILGNEK